MHLDCKHLKPVKADGEVDTTVNDEKRDPHDSGTDEYNAHLKKDVSGEEGVGVASNAGWC